jgi:hypothetical protein
MRGGYDMVEQQPGILREVITWMRLKSVQQCVGLLDNVIPARSPWRCPRALTNIQNWTLVSSLVIIIVAAVTSL